MRYSLSDYILSIEINDPALRGLFPAISIGGEGSYLDSISLSTSTAQWSTTAYATGAWVHSKSLARNGTATLTLNQMSEQIARLKQLVNVHYAGSYEGLTLTLTNSDNVEVARCVDCYIENIPNQEFSSTASTQNWVFTCGQIIYN